MEKQTQINIELQSGLGDNVYASSGIKAASKLYDKVVVKTQWPELFEHNENVYFTEIAFTTRNTFNINNYRRTPIVGGFYRARYNLRETPGYLAHEIGKHLPFQYDLDDFSIASFPRIIEQEYVLVKPQSFPHTNNDKARSPKPEYIQYIVNELKNRGYYVVSVFANEPHEILTNIDQEVTNLDIKQFLSLIEYCEFVVSGVNHIVPISLAYRKNHICIGGGKGLWNNPGVIANKQKTFIPIFPELMCMCAHSSHDCEKDIINFESKVQQALEYVKWN